MADSVREKDWMERHGFATALLGLLAIPVFGVCLVVGGFLISLVLVVPVVAVGWIGHALFGPINLRTPLLLAAFAFVVIVAYEWLKERRSH